MIVKIRQPAVYPGTSGPKILLDRKSRVCPNEYLRANAFMDVFLLAMHGNKRIEIELVSF